MDILFKAICILFFVVFGYFLFMNFMEAGKTVALNKIKRNYNSLGEFLDSYCGRLNQNENKLIYKKQFEDFEFCIKCKEEKESMYLSDIEHCKNKLNEYIFVEYFRTDDESWLHLCGREGYIFKCSKHNIDVYKFITCMN